MKKSELKSLIREEITSALKGEQPLDEMAKIQGELKVAIEAVIEDNPELDGKELKRAIRKDPDVLDALDLDNADELYDNQLNKFIALIRGERTLQQRGRKEGGTNKKHKVEAAPEREMTLESEDEHKPNVLYFYNFAEKDPQGGWKMTPKKPGSHPLYLTSVTGSTEAECNRKAADQIKSSSLRENDEQSIDEMAKISGDLESAIKAVISANPEIEGLPLKKQIKANPDVIKALDGDDLYDNQLNKFIANIKAGKEKGQQGRKPSEAKPATPGAPKSSAPAKPKEKAYSIAPSQTAYTVDKTKSSDEGDKLKGVAEPTDYELKQMARSKSVEDERGETLKQQEKRKLVKAFLAKMQKLGAVDSANRVLDRAKYDEEWAKYQPLIKNKLATIQ